MIEELINQLQAFKRDGYKTLYAIVFGSKQYPCWLILQIIWSCYVVHKSTKQQRRSISLWIRKLLASAIITFLPREIFAYLFHMPSPIATNKLSIIIFITIYSVISLSPSDIVFHILELFSYLIEFLQGINQARLLTLLLRRVKNNSLSSALGISISLLFINMDQMLEILIRRIFNGNQTKFSNPITILQTTIASLIYCIISVYHNKLTKYIGEYNARIGSLMYAFTLGVLNSIPAINMSNDNDPIVLPTPARKSASTSASVSESEYD